MKPSVEQIESLLALKRHERPGEGYFEDFLVEFHRRRREEEAALTGITGLWKRFSLWFSNLGAAKSKWVYGAGVAYASIAALFLLSPEGTQVQPLPVAPVDFRVEPAPALEMEQLEELDLRPSTQGSTGEQVF